MTATAPSSEELLSRLASGLRRIRATPPRLIASPPTQPRRASVAILVRVRPHPDHDPSRQPGYDENEDPSASLSSWGKQSVVAGASASGADEMLQESFTSVRALTQTSEGGDGTSDSQVSQGLAQPQGDDGQIPGHSSTSNMTVNTALAQGQHRPQPDPLSAFFSLPWVQKGTPEVLYIKRASRSSDRWSAHVAFAGGRQEPDDEGPLYTAMRETWEEVGIDLAEKEYLCVGQLDDREITTSLGKRLLMILSPFVFLQTTPYSPLPDLQPTEVASAHWIPLSLLYTPTPRWGSVSIDISSRLAPRSPVIRWCLRVLVGNMHFRCILLPNEPVAEAELDSEEEDEEVRRAVQEEKWAQEMGMVERPDLRLWGLTLGMTLDLLSHMSADPSVPDSPSLPSVSPLSATYPMPSNDPSSQHPSSFDGRNPAQTGTASAGRVSIGGSDTSPSSSNSATDQTGLPSTNTLGMGISVAGVSKISSRAPQRQQALSSSVASTASFPQASSPHPFSRFLTVIQSRLPPSLRLSSPHNPFSSLSSLPPPHAAAAAPSMTSVFPRFSYPDVNFWIWVFGYRYRRVVRGWEESNLRGSMSVGPPGTPITPSARGKDRRVNWAGMALGSFYSAVRRALIVAIVLRAMGVLSLVSFASWLAARRYRRRRRGLEGFGLVELIGTD